MRFPRGPNWVAPLYRVMWSERDLGRLRALLSERTFITLMSGKPVRGIFIEPPVMVAAERRDCRP